MLIDLDDVNILFIIVSIIVIAIFYSITKKIIEGIGDCYYWGFSHSPVFNQEIKNRYKNYRKYIRHLRENKVYEKSHFFRTYPYYLNVLEKICTERIKGFEFSQISEWKLSDWDKMSFAMFNDNLKHSSRIYFRTQLMIERNDHKCQICKKVTSSKRVNKKNSNYSINIVGALEPELLTTICNDCWIRNVANSIIKRDHHKCRICGKSNHLFVIDKETWLGLNQIYKNTLEYDPDSLSTICDGCRFEKVSPKDFEILVAELFKKMGYEVQHTGQVGDAGIDIIINDESGKTIVQCKKYSSKVGVATVRELYGSLIDSKTNNGVIVTTDDYTSGAKEFAEGKPIKLINGIELRKALSNYFL